MPCRATLSGSIIPLQTPAPRSPFGLTWGYRKVKLPASCIIELSAYLSLLSPLLPHPTLIHRFKHCLTLHHIQPLSPSYTSIETGNSNVFRHTPQRNRCSRRQKRRNNGGQRGQRLFYLIIQMSYHEAGGFTVL